MERSNTHTEKTAADENMFTKMDEKKLEWMYSGKQINREEYLLGKRIDASFEVVSETQSVESKIISKNHLDHECVPTSLRFFSGSQQVDLARKMHEDPLYTIKKRETETRDQLLKNPVKLKQIKEQLERQAMNTKDGMKKSDNSENGNDEFMLTTLLIGKYNALKDRIGDKALLKILAKIKYKSSKKPDTQVTSQRYKDVPPHRRRNSHENDWNHRSYNNSMYNEKSFKPNRIRMKQGAGNKPMSESNKPIYLTEAEKEQRRQEMMNNATWRNEERENYMRKHYKEENEEIHSKETFRNDFIRKHLANVAEVGTVAQRIKSNVNSIQRGERAMDTNFAKR